MVVRRPPERWGSEPIGLLTNRAATTRDMVDAARALMAAGVHLTLLMVPEHGLDVSVPPGEPVTSTQDPRSGLPVYSLYHGGVVLAEVLSSVSRVVVDLPDVGARFFTYASTLVQVMQAAAEVGVPVTVLDRPNPITGRYVEGPLMEDALRSFVGMLPVPVRHGLTLGELAHLARHHMAPGVSLDVIRARGWRREMWFDQTGRSWVPPSPNMPHPETALVYPGMCLVEGTNLSEGRGTPYPFQVVGAPWLDGDALARALNKAGLPGVRFRAVTFRPCASKHAGQVCAGVQIHVIDREAFRPVRTGIAILTAARAQAPDHFRFLQTMDGTFTFDRLIGNTEARRRIEDGHTWQDIAHSWEEEEARYTLHKRRYHLYT